MKYFIDQIFFAIKDTINIYDEEKNQLYYAKGRILEVAKKIKLFDKDGNLVYNVNQRLGRILERIDIKENGNTILRVKQKFSLLGYRVNVIDEATKKTIIKIKRKIFTLKYNFKDMDKKDVAVLHRKIHIKDQYMFETLADTLPDAQMLAIAMAIDIIYHSNRRR